MEGDYIDGGHQSSGECRHGVCDSLGYAVDRTVSGMDVLVLWKAALGTEMTTVSPALSRA